MCSQEKIIEKCLKGDNKAAEQLYHMFSAKMFAICLRYTHNRAEAEDNLQDGFMKVFDSLNQYAEKGSFEGWMKKVFIHICLQKIRKERSLFLVEEVPEQEEEDIEENAFVPPDVLEKFIQELPEKYKLVFNLYVLEEMQHKQIASLLGISEGTSKSNLARARDILKKKVKAYLTQYEQ
ncbi:MAG: sigma-70 family RNA polymerase sigma factor [Odoribacter sp.]|nr:sigma-70 family RNA polymerase sigma factor [Odoribacter sp.]